MQFFIDTADTADIRALVEAGFCDGVTTNPSLIAKSGRNILDVIAEICEMVEGPVSAEVAAMDFDTMLKEGRKLASLATNVAVKLPLTMDGLKACRVLSGEGHMVNVTLCFSAAQALMAAKAGATYVSPFVGRLDDVGKDGLELIDDILEIYSSYPDLDTQVLVASVRTVRHVERAAMLGADVVTVPPKIIWDMIKHPFTDKGLEGFMKDWASTGQSIL